MDTKQWQFCTKCDMFTQCFEKHEVKLNATYVPKFIRALSIDGSTIIDFEYNKETGLYHWEGNPNYAGYTAEELHARRC